MVKTSRYNLMVTNRGDTIPKLRRNHTKKAIKLTTNLLIITYYRIGNRYQKPLEYRSL